MADVRSLPDLFTLAELAERYSVGIRTLYDAIDDGLLRAFRFGPGRRWVVHRDDWNDYLTLMRQGQS